MAKKVASQNGHDRLDEAIALLVGNQAAFVAQMAESNQRHAEDARLHLKNERRWLQLKRESDERFALLMEVLNEHTRVLNEHTRKLDEHTRILERLPDALREKIGFKAPQ